MNNTIKNIISLVVILVLLTSGTLFAGVVSSARSTAMGQAYLSLATGIDAARNNPANLGFMDFRQHGIELIGLGASVVNNSFTLKDYNNYTGAFLTDDDKTTILQKIPDQGLTFSADVAASALSIALGGLVFTTEAVGVADINLSKDLLNHVLNGVEFGDTIEVNGSYSEAIGYATAGLSYGRSIYSFGTREVGIGLTVKYIRGFGYEEIVELEGHAATLETGLSGSGQLTARTSIGGSGYGLDLGAAIKFNESYTAGVCIKNFISSVSWSKDTKEYGYVFSFDTMTIENMNDDFVVSDDYTRDIDAFKSGLPSVMTVGVARTGNTLRWAVDWEQGFRRAAGASTKPRLSAGLEWAQLSYMPLRCGFSTGGNRNTAFSFGSGLDLKVYYFDFAVVTGASLSPSSTKGLNMALTTGVRF